MRGFPDQGQHRLGNRQHAEEIDVQHTANGGGFGRAGWSIALFDDSRVVYKNVELAVLGANRIRGLRDGFGVGDVKLDKERIRSVGFQPCHGGLSQFRIAGRDQHRDGVLGELAGYFEAYTLVRAGNQRNLSVVILSHRASCPL